MTIRRVRLLLLLALPFFAGCTAIREARHTCVLMVIVDGGRRLASPAQLASLERRVQPQLAERGLILSHDRRNAAWLARVEFDADPNNPLDGDFTIRVIEPNPTLEIPTAPADLLGPAQRAQDQSLQRQEQQLMREGRRSSP
jgi:hypothetical protein